MNKRKIALGPGAASLILIVVALSLCMLAMLSIIGAKNDYSLCARSASMIEKVYELSAQSEQKLAELDSVLVSCAKDSAGREDYRARVAEKLPEGMEIDGDQVSWSEPLDNRSLECTVQISEPNDSVRFKWLSHKLIVVEPEEDWEW